MAVFFLYPVAGAKKSASAKDESRIVCLPNPVGRKREAYCTRAAELFNWILGLIHKVPRVDVKGEPAIHRVDGICNGPTVYVVRDVDEASASLVAAGARLAICCSWCFA